jgi:phosphatidylglycerophosphate synthase
MRSTRTTSLLAALPDFAIAAAALITWVNPQVLGPDYVGHLFVLMLLEFIVMHSAAFMGQVAFSAEPRRKRVVKTLGLAAFYTMFALGFALGAKAWWPLWSFWGLVVNRLLFILFGGAPDDRAVAYAQKSWAVSAMCYICGIFVTVLLPLPNLGVEPWMAGPLAEGSSGLWVDHPEKMVAFAALYFGLMGWFTLGSHKWGTALDHGSALKVERVD